MPNPAEFFAAFAPSLAWALLDFVWQGMLVAWIAALLLGLLRSARPQARYLVACLALLACIALPVSGVVQRMAAAEPTASFAVVQLRAVVTDSPSSSPVQQAVPDVVQGWESQLSQRLPLVVILWSIGASLLALRMALGLAWVQRRRAEAFEHGDPHWQQVVDRLARRMGIARPVRLGLAQELDSPVTAGWLRPVVLVPAALLSGMPPHYIEALLAHELAHVRRHDYLVNLFQGAVETLLFYHPAVWWLSNRIRAEREQVADDLAASTLGEPRRLALALSELDRFQLSTPQLAPAAHGGDLMSRIKRLVRPASEPLQWKMALPILGLTAACAAFYANAGTTTVNPAPVVAAAVQAAQAARTAAAVAGSVTVQAAAAANAAAQATDSAAAAQAKAARAAAKAERMARRDMEPSYALVRKRESGITMSGSTDSRDWDNIKRLRKQGDGDFLWFRENGKAYVIKDPAIIAQANKAWEQLEALGKEMDGYGAEMEKHGKVMEELGKQMEAAGREVRMEKGADRRMHEIGRKQAAVGAEMAKVGVRMAGKDSAAAEREMARLEKKMEALEKEMEAESAKFEKAAAAMEAKQAPMDAIGRKMDEASKPMDALGKHMDVIGKKMDAESKIAEAKVRSLIDEARSKGLATEVN